MSTITLSLSDKEASVLHGLSTEQELSQQQVLRQALRLYQHVNNRMKMGEQMAFVDKGGNVVRQVIIGLEEPAAPTRASYCREGDRCVCGGDTPGVRAGAGNLSEGVRLALENTEPVAAPDRRSGVDRRKKKK